MKKTIKVNDLASISNLTGRRIRQLSEDGKLPKIKRGVLPMPDAVNQLFKHYQANSAELTRERLETATVNRKIKERELADIEGKFVERAFALQQSIGALKRYHGFVVQELELNLPSDMSAKLKDAGVSIEAAAKLTEWFTLRQQATVDRIEKRCADEVNNPNAEAI